MVYAVQVQRIRQRQSCVAFREYNWLCLPRSDYNYVEYMFLIEYEAISFVFVHVLRSNRHSVVEATELTAADVALPDDDSSIT